MDIGQPERATQKRVVAVFRDELHYRYLDAWRDRDDNSNIKEHLLTPFLIRSGYTPAQINKAIGDLRMEADHHSRGLYGKNKETSNMLLCKLPFNSDAGRV